MAFQVKPYVDAQICALPQSALNLGMRKKAPRLQLDDTSPRLPTTSPGKKSRRTAKALKKSEGAVAVRQRVAQNLKWLLEASGKNAPALAKETGLGVNTVRRALLGKNGTTIDTLFLLADNFGLPPRALLEELNDQDRRLVQMIEGMKKDIEVLREKVET